MYQTQCILCFCTHLLLYIYFLDTYYILSEQYHLGFVQQGVQFIHFCFTDPNVGIRILAGCTTGAMAVSMAQPTDVVKVRFQAQKNLQGVGRRYNGTMKAYRQIFQQEGLRGLWKGVYPERNSNIPKVLLFYGPASQISGPKLTVCILFEPDVCDRFGKWKVFLMPATPKI